MTPRARSALVAALVVLLLVPASVRRRLAAPLLVLVLLQLWVKWRGDSDAPSTVHERRAASWTAGTGVGFATMTANAAGAVMTLYLSASGIDKRRFVGTNAWFFLIVNLVKVPFSMALGLMHPVDAVRALALAPLVLVGGLLGYATVQRISQRRFDLAVLAASALAAGALLLV